MILAKCEKCGKEYQLEPKDDPSDFQCECGGELKYKDSEEVPINTVCPFCGRENPDGTKYCASCGKELKENKAHKSSRNEMKVPIFKWENLNKNYKIFIYSIILLIILDIIWSLYLITGTIQTLLSFLIPVYMGYNLPKNKIVKYTGVLAVLEGIIEGIIFQGSLVSGILVIIIWIIVFIVLGFVGWYLKRL